MTSRSTFYTIVFSLLSNLICCGCEELKGLLQNNVEYIDANLHTTGQDAHCTLQIFMNLCQNSDTIDWEMSYLLLKIQKVIPNWKFSDLLYEILGVASSSYTPETRKSRLSGPY